MVFFLSWLLVRRHTQREGQRDTDTEIERERATQTEREGMRMVCNMYL